ncbi:hypothetical protein HR059_00145 [Sinorhizobium meliloti WSM1022]|jgi:hypothetical protein|uniref:Uncharacterized protein n=2 Tax=Sinorhizobium TaxID=28105 RepID=H0G7L9_RHIML|nr:MULTISPECIES: hypothetical protein [Sinorhizobium]ASQ05361.1 hypothetical protein CDO23_16310 [Sinorhizobium meliloti]EHK74723.1 hypothetical protein SM0020_27506 [Sinorhizobium meliloti CCNWSX0020]MCO6424313.1 hypothetical protein [Sinorhizobium meliloti]MDW9410839.1 hypothetical protein [Sinorhizobium meliloti]MDW9442943.1 hypothetical protein [Sinorhizobium meliloti]
MTWFRFALAPPVIALILTLSPGAGLAGEATFELAQAFHDLPGVRPVDPLRDDKNIVCRQVFIDRYGPFESSHGRPRYDTTYRCREGSGPIFQSGELPPSLERQKRGLNY